MANLDFERTPAADGNTAENPMMERGRVHDEWIAAQIHWAAVFQKMCDEADQRGEAKISPEVKAMFHTEMQLAEQEKNRKFKIFVERYM